MSERIPDDLSRELAREQDRLSTLDAERARTRERIAALRAELEAKSRAPAETQIAPPRSPGDKVALFRSLFRGRTDVFARHWVNERKRIAGYAPACSHEWVREVCEKPRIKCGECLNQAFIPLDDEVVLDHLRGRHVVGLYPLLEDETCWLLAADFDKASWEEDAAAFSRTCERLGVPAAVERSRSGQGAHVWCFFEAPVPAALARQMGCYLLTETMAERHELSMRSYDRLFPNQDTMPRGGFGSLIALPLQHAARQHGNSVFVDCRWEPHPDQWEFLASVPRMAPAEVEALAHQAVERGQIIGVAMPEGEDDGHGATPWLRLHSRRPRPLTLSEPPPERVRAVLASQLFVEKAGLSSPLLNALKRTAAFQNPEFYKKQAMRLSTALTPRVVACAEDLPQHLALPRGCLEEVRILLQEIRSDLELRDEREEGRALDVAFRGELTKSQSQAVRALVSYDAGILVAPAGAGKTVVATDLISRRARNTLILVHRTQLVEQWIARLAMFLDIEAKQIGRIGGGRRKPNGDLDVAMIQSLVRKNRVDDLVATYGHVIVDECHHIPAVSFERVMREVKARFITGLTATPHRRDGHHPILQLQLGPVRFTIQRQRDGRTLPFSHRLLVRETSFTIQRPQELGIQEIYRQLAHDHRRNDLILDDIIAAVAEGRSPFVLTERRDHLELLAERLKAFVGHLVVLRGGMRSRERRAAAKQLASISEAEERLLLATGRFVSEGFDDARLDTLFLTMPVSWRGTLVQYAGRLHRLHPSKEEVRIYDYVDRQVPMLSRMFDKRLRGYQAMGYRREPRAVSEPPADCTLDRDDREGLFRDKESAAYRAPPPRPGPDS